MNPSTSRCPRIGKVTSRLARADALPCEASRRTKKARICAVFQPSVSTPSDLNPMSSSNHVACSAASAWQWAFINSPR